MKKKGCTQDKETSLAGNVKKLSQRIDQAVQKLDSTAKPRGGTGLGAR